MALKFWTKVSLAMAGVSAVKSMALSQELSEVEEYYDELVAAAEKITDAVDNAKPKACAEVIEVPALEEE